MKITSVELQPAGSASVCVLSFRDPSRSNPYNVKGIVGLDADEILARYYGGSGSSAKYNLKLAKRDIVVDISLNPRYNLDETFSSLRDELYKVIASSRTGVIQIAFKNDEDTIAVVSGFVTKMEAPQFEKDQSAKVTVACNDPMLRSPDPIDVVIGAMLPTDTVINDPLSTAPHGFSFVAHAVDTFPSLVITDPSDGSWNFTITPAGGFINGDILHFSSEADAKVLYLVRAGVTIYLADALGFDSVWPIMFPGNNEFIMTPGAGLLWDSIQYKTAYWGV